MLNTTRLLAGASLATFMAVPLAMPAAAQTEIDIASMTCAEYAVMDGETLVAVLEALGTMPLPDDQMADDGVPNNDVDLGGIGAEPSGSPDDPDAEEPNAMSEADVADDAVASDPVTDDLGETITLACEGTPDATVIDALAAFK